MTSPTRLPLTPSPGASQSACVTPLAHADALLALSDRAYEAQCALSAIKSYAYGGIVTDSEVRERAVALRDAASNIESLINGQAQELPLG
jgi:hypothetical protein